MFTERNPTRLDEFLLEVLHYRSLVLDVGGVGVIDQADDVVIQNPELGGEEVEVNKLCRWPNDPLC